MKSLVQGAAAFLAVCLAVSSSASGHLDEGEPSGHVAVHGHERLYKDVSCFFFSESMTNIVGACEFAAMLPLVAVSGISLALDGPSKDALQEQRDLIADLLATTARGFRIRSPSRKEQVYQACIMGNLGALDRDLAIRIAKEHLSRNGDVESVVLPAVLSALGDSKIRESDIPEEQRRFFRYLRGSTSRTLERWQERLSELPSKKSSGLGPQIQDAPLDDSDSATETERATVP